MSLLLLLLGGALAEDVLNQNNDHGGIEPPILEASPSAKPPIATASKEEEEEDEKGSVKREEDPSHHPFRACQHSDGSFLPSATACEDALGGAACAENFPPNRIPLSAINQGIVGMEENANGNGLVNTNSSAATENANSTRPSLASMLDAVARMAGESRPSLCEAPELHEEALQCAKTCRLCCQLGGTTTEKGDADGNLMSEEDEDDKNDDNDDDDDGGLASNELGKEGDGKDTEGMGKVASNSSSSTVFPTSTSISTTSNHQPNNKNKRRRKNHNKNPLLRRRSGSKQNSKLLGGTTHMEDNIHKIKQGEQTPPSAIMPAGEGGEEQRLKGGSSGLLGGVFGDHLRGDHSLLDPNLLYTADLNNDSNSSSTSSSFIHGQQPMTMGDEEHCADDPFFILECSYLHRECQASEWAAAMGAFCRRTCNLCNNFSSSPTHTNLLISNATSASVKANGEPGGGAEGNFATSAKEDTDTNAMASGPCVDMHLRCSSSSSPSLEAFCEDSTHGALLQQRCPKMCGRCGSDISGGGDGGSGSEKSGEESNKLGREVEGSKNGGGEEEAAVTTSNECVDRSPECGQFLDRCEHDLYRGLMRTHCYRSCGYCTALPPVSSSSIDREEGRSGVDENGGNGNPVVVTPPDGASDGGGGGGGGDPSRCVDTHTNCWAWAANGFCNSTFYEPTQKLELCARTCEMC